MKCVLTKSISAGSCLELDLWLHRFKAGFQFEKMMLLATYDPLWIVDGRHSKEFFMLAKILRYDKALCHHDITIMNISNYDFD